MKYFLILVIVLTSSVTAHAAKWAKLKAEDSVFAQLFEQVDLYESAHLFVSKKDSEDMTRSMEQLTYLIRHDWGRFSMPEGVDVGYVGTDADFGWMSADDTRREPAPFTDKTLQSLKAFTDAHDVEIYAGNDGNSFGDCATTYIHHLKTNQVGVLSVCYAE